MGETEFWQSHPAVYWRQLHNTGLGISNFLEEFAKMKANMARYSNACMIITFALYSACSDYRSAYKSLEY